MAALFLLAIEFLEVEIPQRGCSSMGFLNGDVDNTRLYLIQAPPTGKGGFCTRRTTEQKGKWHNITFPTPTCYAYHL